MLNEKSLLPMAAVALCNKMGSKQAQKEKILINRALIP